MGVKRKEVNWNSVVLILILGNLLVLDFLMIRRWHKNPAVLSSSTISACPAACLSLINTGKGGGVKEQTIPISASGTTTSTEWTDVAGSEISFNKINYKGFKKLYFQANLGSDAGDRKAFARLYDATNGVGIQGSDVFSSSTTLAFVQSGEINPFGGELKVRVQIKGLNGNLVSISNPRIVVKY